MKEGVSVRVIHGIHIDKIGIITSYINDTLIYINLDDRAFKKDWLIVI